MNKLKGSKAIKLIVIVITILLIALLVLLVGKSKGITMINLNSLKTGETTWGLTVKYLDVDTTILIFEYPQKIKSIKCPDGSEISCNGKNRIAMDLKIVPGTNYTFEVTDENDNVTTEGFTGQSSYWLTYNLRGGSGQPERQLKVSGQTLKLSDITPSAYIYPFKGWSTDPNATEGTYWPGDNFEENEPVSLYAIWGKNWANITDLKTQANELEEGQHVIYNGVEYVVLYQYKDHETKYTPENGYAEDYGQYGTQLIATDVVKNTSGNVEKTTYGGTTEAEGINSWNTYIETLNAKANNYILEEDKDNITGRSVGSHPNPARINETGNYAIDYNQMKKMGISGVTSPFPISYDYALADRYYENPYGWAYRIRYVSANGDLDVKEIARWMADITCMG